MTCPNLEHYGTTLRILGFVTENSTTDLNDDSDESTADPFADNSEDDFCPSDITEINSSDWDENPQSTVSSKRKHSNYKSRNENQKRQKLLKNSGLPYQSQSKSKKNMNQKCLQPPCGEKCRLQCSKQIMESSRKEIFHKYWSTADLQRQREFIASHTTPIKPKYRYLCGQDFRRLNSAFYLEVNSKKIRVCKTFFKATLDINDTVIRTTIKKMGDDGFLDIDHRGRHNKHVTVNPEVKNSMRAFINNIPRVESHYLRAQTSPIISIQS